MIRNNNKQRDLNWRVEANVLLKLISSICVNS